MLWVSSIVRLSATARNSGVPATSRKILNKLKAKEEIANDAFKLAQNNWELYVEFFGKKMSSEKSKDYEATISFQEQALQDLIDSDINNFMKNMKTAHDLYKKIKV